MLKQIPTVTRPWMMVPTVPTHKPKTNGAHMRTPSLSVTETGRAVETSRKPLTVGHRLVEVVPVELNEHREVVQAPDEPAPAGGEPVTGSPRRWLVPRTAAVPMPDEVARGELPQCSDDSRPSSMKLFAERGKSGVPDCDNGEHIEDQRLIGQACQFMVDTRW